MFDLSNIYIKHDAESRSITAENLTGARGAGGMATPENALNPAMAQAARELGQGWKVQPCRQIKAGETVAIAEIEGPGVIRHMWFTFSEAFYRTAIIRIYWDDQSHPSVECPLGDFMCNAWNTRQRITAIPMNVNPVGGMNCYLPMPFRRSARITIENRSDSDLGSFFYTINYTLESVPDDALALHASWRRQNPLPAGSVFVMADGIEGQGQYIGTFMSWQQNTEGWWGEGEIKMFIDDDDEFPTICGTGTEDYFGGAWGFGDTPTFSAPYMGFDVCSGKNLEVGARMTLYRFHIHDPVFFKCRLRVTMQALGWQDGGRYLQLEDDIGCIVYWYQTLPGAALPPLSGDE